MKINLSDVKNEMSRRHLFDFTKRFIPKLESTQFHDVYYELLDMFSKGEIKRLIVSVSPQHGKSEGSTRKLPAFMLGHNKNLNVALASYNDTMAKKFGRDIKRTMRDPDYMEIFNTRIPERIDTGHTNTANEVDIIKGGSLRFVGRGGSLTGNTVDIMIMDDLYKDFAEGNSPIIRESVWDWYTTVVKTRLHNDSQELIVFTRWHEDDLIGRLELAGKVIEITSLSQIKDIPSDMFVKINFEGIKESNKTEIDSREIGEALWPSRHSIESLIDKRKLDPLRFNCLYQGDPASREGVLYGEFKTYKTIDANIIRRGNYTDTADMGDDYLCSINYDATDDLIYVKDVYYTQDSMEITEPNTTRLLNNGNINTSHIESNNGGRGFARVIANNCRAEVIAFHQSGNKESRILTNSSEVNRRIVFPSDWAVRWPLFYRHVTSYKRMFKANKHDDGADCLTGIIEKNPQDSGSVGFFV